MSELSPDLVARLGEELVRKRLHREHSLWHREKVESLKSAIVRAIVHVGLRMVGLWRRAYREFLDIRIVENVVPLPSLPREFDGFRLMQITDLHSDIDEALIPRVIESIKGVAFDQCVLTGDYHDRIGNDWNMSLALTIRLVPHLGQRPLAILGNHDRLAKVPPLEAAGIRMLLNERVAIERNGARIWICGVDDAHMFGTHDLHAASAGIPAGDCRILLSHSPETWTEAAALGYALHLSGHTHGGQLCLPGGFAIVTKSHVPRRLLAGPWREGSMLGYTSRGTGSCSVPARLNCPPEITIHILKCA
ncbi:MAG: metallophosphoesterase [Chthoniobacterales bacterium]